MSHFKILIQHYLRCLLRMAVRARTTLTRLGDYTPLLHVMYECVRGAYFSWPRHCPWREVRIRLPLNNWPAATPRTERGRRRGSAAQLVLVETAKTCLHFACRSPCPVNWNTKQSRVDGRAAVAKMKRKRRRRRCSRCLSPATFTARWKLTVEAASETDTLSLVKWTVTLHFSTSWQRRIGRFEPCDVTLIEFWFSPPGLQRKQGRFYTKRAGLSTQRIPWKRSLLPSPPLIISLCCFVTLLLS